MEIFHWIGEYGYQVLEGVGIIGGLAFSSYTTYKDEQARKLSNLIAIKAQHIDIWKEAYRIWFEGKRDPELVLLRFTPFDAEYWDSAGTHGMRQAFEAAKAYLSGQKLDPTEHDPEAYARVQL